MTGSFRNALCCICHSPECFPILIPHISMLKPGTQTSGLGVTGRGCNARVCRGVCDNGNILTLIVQQEGLFVTQNHNAVWRYLELEWKCREQRNACSSHQSQTPLWFLTNSSCSLRGQLCWVGGTVCYWVGCSWIQWNKVFLFACLKRLCLTL